MRLVPPEGRRWIWIAAGIGLVLAVMIVSLFAGFPGLFRPSAAGSSPSSVAASGSPALSAAEAARRAANAKLGPIKHRSGRNAVDSYQRAMVLYNQLSDQERGILHGGVKSSPEMRADLAAKIQPILQLMRDGRKADYADWGVTSLMHDYGAELVANMKTVQTLAQVAQWDASYRFDTDAAGALDDLSAADFLASSDSTSIIGLLGDLGVRNADVR